MEQNDGVRCFIAIELPSDVKRVLSDVSAGLRRANAGVKWVEPDAVHLTLKFLGNVPTAMIPEIEEALRAACASFRPLHLQIAKLGCFPSQRNPRVIWVGLEGDREALADLAVRIDKSLSALGFPLEMRPFSPHLTLGRVRQEATATQRDSLVGALDNATQLRSASFNAEEVSLMRSDLSPQGARYTCLGRTPLAP